MTALEATYEEYAAELARRKEGITLAEEAERLSGSLRLFLRECWPYVVPVDRVEAWHLDTIAEHLEAAYAREIPKLVITIQPGSLKSTLVSVVAPAWWWTRKPSERIVSASHADHLSTRDTRLTRQLIQSEWYQNRFGERFRLTLDENLKTRYSNTKGGHRIATHVQGGTGDRGGVTILDDPHNAKEIQSEAQLAAACTWFGDTWASRLNASVDDPGVSIVIGQRLHERDVIGFLLDGDPDGERWTHLCLPTHYVAKHPFVYPEKRVLVSGRVVQGDLRKQEDELLAPLFQDEQTFQNITSEMSAQVIAGQYQQLPAPREGDLLKRADWRYYDRELSYYAERNIFDADAVANLRARIGAFERIVHSWDTSLKDRKDSDFVAGGVYGSKGSDLYALRLFHQRLGLNATIEAMDDLYGWAIELWPDLPHHVIIESAANGLDAIAEIKRRVRGVTAITAKGSKEMRAEAASPALEGGNMFLPGYRAADGSGYDERTPSDVQRFVEEAAKFPNGVNDDEVDQWSQAVNWTRKRGRPTSVMVGLPVGRA